uniref:Uncharacterized protein n=1 Tax=Trichobilharzia regenti TaxID=157069 RepID=A0AA85IWE1_TRIRE|nr:unnamed protein product [Trichobilharzia regenti]
MVSLGIHWKRFISACSTSTGAGGGPIAASSSAGASGVGTSAGKPSTPNSLQKSPVEWQCLNETVNILLKGCPVSRLAILDHLAPLYIDYFVTWWQMNSPLNRSHEVSGNAGRYSSFESQNFNKAEVVLRDLLQTIHELITEDRISDHFYAAVCSWCLVLIRPVCTSAPTQILSNFMDLLKSPSHHSDKPSSSSTSMPAKRVHKTHPTGRIASNKSERNIDNNNNSNDCNKMSSFRGINRRRYGKHPSDQHRNHLIVVSDSESSSNSTSDEDNVEQGSEEEKVEVEEVISGDVRRDEDTVQTSEVNIISSSINKTETSEIKPVSINSNNQQQSTDVQLSSYLRNDQISSGLNRLDSTDALLNRSDSTAEHTIDLDLSPTSVVNQQIIGIWMKCPLLLDLLNITCSCLLGPDVRMSCVQALLCCSTVPVWDTSFDNLKNSCSLPNYVLPHWIIIWLLYQTTRQVNLMSSGLKKLNRLCDLILTSALMNPMGTNTLQSILLPDTLAGYFSQWNFDSNFWTTVCLTHLLFLGDSVPEFVGKWLRTKMEPLFSYALGISPNETSPNDNESLDNRGCLTQQMKLFNLLISLSLISVPVPPQSPPEQQIPLGSSSHPTSDISMDRSWRHPQPFFKGFNYTGMSVPFRPGGPCLPNEMDSAPMLPRFPVPLPPRNMNPTFPGPRHMPIPPGGGNSSNNMMNTGLPTGQTNSMPFRFNFPRPFEAPLHRPPLLQVPVNVQSLRPNLNNLYYIPTVCGVGGGGLLLFNERQSAICSLQSGRRQPSSLIWILSLIRRIKAVTISIIIDNLVSLTPLHLFSLFQNQCELNQQTAYSLLHLIVKAIIQAPFGSNVEQLLVYLINICETEANQSSVNFVCPIPSVSTAAANIDELQCPNAKKKKLTVDDQRDQNQSASGYDNFLNNFVAYCREILRLLCETTLVLIYSLSETSDLLDQGGCEGFLRAIQQLADRPSPSLLYNSIDTPAAAGCTRNDKTIKSTISSLFTSKFCLFQKLMNSNHLQSSSCAQMILSLGFTLEPSSMEHLLFYLCCWKPCAEKSDSNGTSLISPVSSQRKKSTTTATPTSQDIFCCPLMLFFPILNEIQSIWTARTSCKPPSLPTETSTQQKSTSSLSFIRSSIYPTTSVRSEYLLMQSHINSSNDNSNNNNDQTTSSSLSLTSPNGLLYIQQLLANKFLPLMWSNVENGTGELRTRLLRNLLWLVYREMTLIRKKTVQPRLLFALAAHFDTIVKIMVKSVNLECTDLLLSLCECIFSSFQFSSSTNDPLHSYFNNVNNNNSNDILLTKSCDPRQLPHAIHHPQCSFITTRPRHGYQSKEVLKPSNNNNSPKRHHQLLAFLHLSPGQCILLAQSFVQLISQLFRMSNEFIIPRESTSSLSSSSPDIYFDLLGRIRNLLKMLYSFEELSIFRSTLLRLIPKAMMSDYTESNLDDLFKAVIPTITDNHDLFNISYLPSSLFSNAPSSTDIPSKLHNNLLLLNNPPKKTDQTFDDSLIRGQLKPRMNKNTEITISNGVIPINMKGTLGDGPRGLDFHPMLNMIKKPKINGINWQPVELHWLNLIRFTIMDGDYLFNMRHSESVVVLTPQQQVNNNSFLVPASDDGQRRDLISGLEDVVMQTSGIHLPQTSIISLPFPSLNLVLPPSGVGLERVVNLLYWFCPEAKQLMSDSGRDAGSQLDDPQHSMIQLSSQGILEISIILEKLRLKCYGLPPLCHPLPLYALYFCETSSILHFLDPLPFLSSPKILLGILMGLEAVWASPVAPRISIQQAINTLIQVDDISYVEQSFPVCGANKACKTHARKGT